MSHARLRRFSPVALVVLAAGLVGASLAWACSPQATITVKPAFGLAGIEADVTGAEFIPNYPVEVRWESASGQVVGVGEGPAFTETIRIPRVPADTYMVVGRQFVPGDPDRGTRDRVWTARAPFEVIVDRNPQSGNKAPASRPPSRGTVGFFRSTRNPQPAEPRPGTDGASLPGGRRGAPLTGSSGRRRGNDAAAVGGSGSGGSGASTADAGSSSVGVVTRAGEDVFAGSMPRTAQSTSGSGQAPGGLGAPGKGRRPSEGTATGDLWSAFASGERPSLVPGLTDPAALDEEGPGAELALGAGLLGLGLVAMFSGFAVAEVRRRRRALS